MGLYADYLLENERREIDGLSPKPIEDGQLINEIILRILDTESDHRDSCLNFLVFNTLPGTTAAAGVKAKFLKDIITGKESVEEITAEYAFELLSHMRGGPSVEVLLDLALGDNEPVAKQAADIPKNAGLSVRR